MPPHIRHYGAGNREEPVVVNEKPLYFRGRRIIDETLSALKANFGLGNAENVMLTGMSMCHLIPPSLRLHLL